MIIQHNRIKNAIVHLANKQQKKYPESRYGLVKAQKGGNGWAITISLITTATTDISPLPPPSVNFDELGSDDHDNLDDIVIKTNYLAESLEVADRFVETVDDLATAILFSVTRVPDHWGKINIANWRMIYFAKNTKGKDVVITLKINDEGVITSNKVDIISDEA